MLAPLAAAFRAVDPGSTGILSPTQCQRFCRLLHPSIAPEEADLLLGTLDCGTGQVRGQAAVADPYQSHACCACLVQPDLESPWLAIA